MQLQRHVIYTRCTLPRCRAPEAGAGCLSQLPVDHASIAGYSVRPLVEIKDNAGRYAITGRADGARQKYCCCYAGTAGITSLFQDSGPARAIKRETKLPSNHLFPSFRPYGLVQFVSEASESFKQTVGHVHYVYAKSLSLSTVPCQKEKIAQMKMKIPPLH